MNSTDTRGSSGAEFDACLNEARIGFPLTVLDALLESMGAGACVWDADLRLVAWNSAYRRVQPVPDCILKRGARLADILDNGPQLLNDDHTGEELEALTRKLLVAKGGLELDRVLADGRTVSVTYDAFGNGCWIAFYRDVHNSDARIRYLARHDVLTGLPNRLMFREIMEGVEERIRRRETLAILAIDLDRFKVVNDTLGHGVGDKLIRLVAERLRACCREGDVVSRVGGDEFAIITGPLHDGADAAKIADRVVMQIAETFQVDGHDILIGASVGIAVAPGDGLTSDALLKNADLALYRAKDGRSRYHFFEKGMDVALQERRGLEHGLRRALAANEFRLVFQPLFDIDKGHISGLQALLRWCHPERGTVPPNEFMPVAEETGLAVPIGEWVLREACHAAVAWPDDVRVVVKPSVVQFRKSGLSEHVKAALKSSGLRPERLELGVTESLFLSGGETIMGTLHELRQLGVRISMDNFGAGYSSLRYLTSFPFDGIKIDQSFVEDLSAKEHGGAVLNAVVGLGRSLGISTTADGVETATQLDLVRRQGCTEVQGFLFSPPLPGSAITKLFAETSGLEEWKRALLRAG